MAKPIEPYIPASKSPLELTIRAVILGLLLSFIMCAANIYVGLYAGMTVSAAIPASVISMGVLRGLFRTGTILENNIVHTIASSGESLAAGIIFTVPAIYLLGIWDEFNYWETTLIAMAGGVMGVVMMIPLRKPMIIDQEELKFPEGVACAEVLKAGDRGGADMKGVFVALGIGFLFKGLVDLVGLFKGSVVYAVQVGRTGFLGGLNISPMMMAVGFIVGWEIALLVVLGGALSYVVAIPVLAYDANFAAADTSVQVVLETVWDEKIRYFGIGAMLVAGLYSILRIGGTIKTALATVIENLGKPDAQKGLPRTEQSISGGALLGLLSFSLALCVAAYWMMTQDVFTTVIAAISMFVLAFFFVAVASYIVGLVGSSNSPVSGMTICAVLIAAALMLALGYYGSDEAARAGMLATLGVAGVVCCAACTSGDICQDLKIAQIVGATPRRLQIGEVIGTILPAFIIAPTMNLLNEAYGIADKARPESLAAPQGVMFQKLVGGFFGNETIPWVIVGVGAIVGVAAIVIDHYFLEPRKTRFRLHAMPLAVGMYLPWEVTVPMLIGGLAYWLIERRSLRRGDTEEQQQTTIHRGLLFSSGLVAGEAIMGIVGAVFVVQGLSRPILSGPKAWTGLPENFLKYTPDFLDHGVVSAATWWSSLPPWLHDVVSLGGLAVVTCMLYRTSLRRRTQS